MLHTNNPIIKHKAGLLNRAQELGNAVVACLALPEIEEAHQLLRTPKT